MPVKISKSAAKKIAAFMRDFLFRRSLANLTCCKIDTFKMNKKPFAPQTTNSKKNSFYPENVKSYA